MDKFSYTGTVETETCSRNREFEIVGSVTVMRSSIHSYLRPFPDFDILAGLFLRRQIEKWIATNCVERSTLLVCTSQS